tara:strand:+ start:1906 stop:2799 length:894 start_codon:yes stop_codon:yes gene_type:complete
LTLIKESSQNILLYAVTILIWGSSWLAIKFQLGSVDPMASVAYRFLLASAISLIFCFFSGRLKIFSPLDHFFMFLQGSLLFALNYWLFYLSELTLTSGLAAVIFSTVVIMNMLNGIIFLQNRLENRVVIGSSLGLIGILFVFWPELINFETKNENIKAVFFALLATYLASLGNIVSARNQLKGISVLQSNTFGMTYGSLLMLFVCILTGKELSFELTLTYVSSLFFLSLFASIIAFWTYLTLLGRVGVERAAYSTLLFPIVALAISTVAENYQWSIFAVLGILLILSGNLIILRREY